MDYQVILSPLALEDLEEIVRYIAADDPAAAERLGTRLFDQAETLCRLPHRGGSARRRQGVKKCCSVPTLSSTAWMTPRVGWKSCGSGMGRKTRATSGESK